MTEPVTFCSAVSLIALLSVMLKLLLFPAYTSTDFEVHRNWLAITYSLPHSKWYYEETSEWTLDYPPLFAWFEWVLSQVAVLVDTRIVEISKLAYKSQQTLYFQRGSVILSDFVLLIGAYKCCHALPKLKSKIRGNTQSENDIQMIFFMLIAFSFGLLIVDHIHFQYNGFLFGILFLSFANMHNGHILWSAFWFAVLLNLKHIFLYIAPVYGIYLFRVYCMDQSKSGFELLKSFRFQRLFSLAVIVISVFSITYGPFLNHLPQIASRLFPFKRGLTHAYWAPNFWAIYNFADKVAQIICTKYKLLEFNSTASSTSGLVQNVDHLVLPTVPTVATFMLTFISTIPCLVKVFIQPFKSNTASFNQFLRTIVLCSLCSFMFGWHVHEKAILMAVLPLSLLALNGRKQDAKVFLILQAAGHYSLFPLLFTQFETVIKLCIFALFTIFSFVSFSHVYRDQVQQKSWCLPLLNYAETLYIGGIALVEIFCHLSPVLPVLKRFTYLPLLVTSVYCAVGVTYSWGLLYTHVLTVHEIQPVDTHKSPVRKTFRKPSL